VTASRFSVGAVCLSIAAVHARMDMQVVRPISKLGLTVHEVTVVFVRMHECFSQVSFRSQELISAVWLRYLSVRLHLECSVHPIGSAYSSAVWLLLGRGQDLRGDVQARDRPVVT